jgi:hypothetical protein
MCRDCDETDDEHSTCADCSDLVASDQMIGTRCEACAEDYGMCEDCDEETRNDDLNMVHRRDRRGRSEERYVCDDCQRRNYSRCADCDEWHHDENVMSSGPNASICRGCYEDSYFTCQGCDEVCHNDNYNSDGYCDDCSRSEEDGPILGYGCDYHLNKIGKPKDGIYFGIELEVEVTNPGTRGERAEETLSSLGRDFAVCMHDGSLADDGKNGFEIISAPATVAVHRGAWSDFLENTNGLTSWKSGNCGMHVHVSRAPLSQLTTGKILVFVNDPANKTFIEHVAGRSSEAYAKLQKKKVSDAKGCAGGRYQAINLENPNTIEFRIFRGTLKKESFFKNLEFVAACVDFAKSTGLRDLRSIDFLRFVDSRRKDYPALVAWLRSKNYIPSPKQRVSQCA